MASADTCTSLEDFARPRRHHFCLAKQKGVSFLHAQDDIGQFMPMQSWVFLTETSFPCSFCLKTMWVVMLIYKPPPIASRCCGWVGLECTRSLPSFDFKGKPEEKTPFSHWVLLLSHSKHIKLISGTCNFCKSIDHIWGLVCFTNHLGMAGIIWTCNYK